MLPSSSPRSRSGCSTWSPFSCSRRHLAGWRTSPGSVDRKSGEEPPPTQEKRTQRPVLYGGIWAVLICSASATRCRRRPSREQGRRLPAAHLRRDADGRVHRRHLVSARLAAARVGRRRGIRRRNDAMDLAVWVVVGGMVGSKILFIIVTPKDFLERWGAATCRRCSARWAAGSSSTGDSSARRWRLWFCGRGNPLSAARRRHRPHRGPGAGLRELGCFAAGCCWGKPASMHAWAVRFPGRGGRWTSSGSTPGARSPGTARRRSSGAGSSSPPVEVFDHPVPGAIRISDWVRPARHHAAHPPDAAL